MPSPAPGVSPAFGFPMASHGLGRGAEIRAARQSKAPAFLDKTSAVGLAKRTRPHRGCPGLSGSAAGLAKVPGGSLLPLHLSFHQGATGSRSHSKESPALPVLGARAPGASGRDLGTGPGTCGRSVGSSWAPPSSPRAHSRRAGPGRSALAALPSAGPGRAGPPRRLTQKLPLNSEPVMPAQVAERGGSRSAARWRWEA